MTRTRRLYHEDPELRTFEATVLSAVAIPSGAVDVVLDQTAFYPTGGGQPHDRGVLGGVEILDVFEAEDTVVHRLAAHPPEPRLVGEVDWERRTDHRQQHSGQHILSRALLNVAEAQTVGFHLGADACTIDLDREPDEAILDQAERMANEVVMADHAVDVRWVDSAADLPGGLRKEVPVEGPIRIVAMGPFDATTCCGTHCARTGQVGPIKVLRFERRRGGLRVEFVCGRRALEDYRRRHRILRAAARAFSAEEFRVAERVESLVAEHKALRTRLEALEANWMEGLVEAWAAEPETGPFSRTLEEGRVSWLAPMAGRLAERRSEAVLLASGDGTEARVVLSVPPGSAAHAGNTLRAMLQESGGRGGGADRMAQGVLPREALAGLLERWREKGTQS